MTRRRILIVEDDQLVAEDLRSRVTKLGHDVVGIADSGEDGIRSAGLLRPDLVLMDVRLRGAMDGFEAGKSIQASLSALVLYVTANPDPDRMLRVCNLRAGHHGKGQIGPVPAFVRAHIIQGTVVRFNNYIRIEQPMLCAKNPPLTADSISAGSGIRTRLLEPRRVVYLLGFIGTVVLSSDTRDEYVSHSKIRVQEETAKLSRSAEQDGIPVEVQKSSLTLTERADVNDSPRFDPHSRKRWFMRDGRDD